MVTMATIARTGIEIAPSRPVPKTFRGSVAITCSAARTWRVPMADQEQTGDQGCQEHPEREQEGRRPEERAQRDQLGVEALDVAGDLHAFGLGHGRLDGADVAGDRGPFLEGERAADDHDRLDGRAVERRVPLDHRQRVDGSGDVRIAVRHEDNISLLAGRQRDVATEGHQDSSGVGVVLVRSERDGRGERGDNQDGPEQAGQAFHGRTSSVALAGRHRLATSYAARRASGRASMVTTAVRVRDKNRDSAISARARGIRPPSGR